MVCLFLQSMYMSNRFGNFYNTFLLYGNYKIKYQIISLYRCLKDCTKLFSTATPVVTMDQVYILKILHSTKRMITKPMPSLTKTSENPNDVFSVSFFKQSIRFGTK